MYERKSNLGVWMIRSVASTSCRNQHVTAMKIQYFDREIHSEPDISV
jgi:hypothetical protein